MCRICIYDKITVNNYIYFGEVFIMSADKKVVVADDYRISREYFEMHIKITDGFTLAKSMDNAQGAVAYCIMNKVDIVVMDVLMRNGIDGLTAAEMIKSAKPDIKIIMATSTSESGWEKRAKKIGVESFWYKEYSRESFDDVLKRTAAGESVYPTNLPDSRLGDAVRSDFTARELDVLREMCSSESTNEDVASKLGISLNTLRTHIKHILSKTGYTSRQELIARAREQKFVVSDDTLRGSANN